MYLTMLSGNKIDLQCPAPASIRLSDIAHNLSMICRFNGSCPRHYSVAEHCLLASELIRPLRKSPMGLSDLKIGGLLHDGHEAYTGDIITPIKKLIPSYERVAQSLDCAIVERLLPNEALAMNWIYSRDVKYMDLIMLDAEIRTFFPDLKLEREDYVPDAETENLIMIIQSKIKFLPAAKAKELFLIRARELGIYEG